MAYVPSRTPAVRDIEELRDAVWKEFEAISNSLQETTAVDLRPVYKEPLRPREGMVVFADGTEWNPGAGKGVYTYSGGAWSKL